LCGDHNFGAATFISIDVGQLVYWRVIPLSAQGFGGRQVRTGKDNGEIF